MMLADLKHPLYIQIYIYISTWHSDQIVGMPSSSATLSQDATSTVSRWTDGDFCRRPKPFGSEAKHQFHVWKIQTPRWDITLESPSGQNFALLWVQHFLPQVQSPYWVTTRYSQTTQSNLCWHVFLRTQAVQDNSFLLSTMKSMQVSRPPVDAQEKLSEYPRANKVRNNLACVRIRSGMRFKYSCNPLAAPAAKTDVACSIMSHDSKSSKEECSWRQCPRV